jgi:hypothetical protein
MKHYLIILLIGCIIMSCKKEGNSTNFIITDVDRINHSLTVNPSNPYIADVSIVNFIPPQGIGPLPSYYSIDLNLTGGNAINRLFLSLPSLQMQSTSYDSTYFFNQDNQLIIEGVTYFSNGANINSVSISLSPHSWVGEQINSIASGSLDLSLDAVSSQNINGNIKRLNDLHKKIFIKGSFKNIFANL